MVAGYQIKLESFYYMNPSGTYFPNTHLDFLFVSKYFRLKFIIDSDYALFIQLKNCSNCSAETPFKIGPTHYSWGIFTLYSYPNKLIFISYNF